MNIRELAESDLGEILDEDGVDATLIDLEENEYSVKCLYFRIGVDIDPNTGATIPGNRSTVLIRIGELGESVIPEEGWTVATTDVTGAEVTGKINYAALDRTHGAAMLILRV